MHVFQNFTLLLLFVIAMLAPLERANAQTERAVVNLSDDCLQHEFSYLDGSYLNIMHGSHPVPIQASPFLAYSITWESTDWREKDNFQIFFGLGAYETEATQITPDIHAERNGTKRISHLYFADKAMDKFRIQYQGESKIENVNIHFFSPGESAEKSSSLSPQPSVNRMVCTCPQPEYLDRAGWCPDGSCPPDPTPVNTFPTHLIVHHSAGSNTSSDWAATVRAIWDFHVNVNGWDDVGYNWLVDPNGVLYEGRGDNRLGAHFCGMNTSTMGVCVLGDFTNITPTGEAYNKLEQLLTWKICDIDQDPLGSGFLASTGLNLMHISGHRDGCNTSCPGDSFYPTLDGVRTSVDFRIDNDCEASEIIGPSSLTASLNGPGTAVILNWVDNSENESSFIVERSVNTNDNFTTLSTLPANTTSVPDFGVSAPNGYYYRVKSLVGGASSPYTNEVFVDLNAAAVYDTELDGGSVQIFPNPTSEKLTLSIDNQWIGGIDITLMDALGRQAQSSIFTEKTAGGKKVEMDLSDLPAGVFLVKIEQGNGAVGTYRVLKR